MELFLVAIANPFSQTSKGTHSGWNVSLKTNMQRNECVHLASKWGELFIWIQSSHPGGDERQSEGREWLRGGWGVGRCFASWIGFDKLGLSVLKWASVSSSQVPLPCVATLRGYLVVNPPHFPGFSLSFHSDRNNLKGKCLLPSPVLEVTLWAMMWWRRSRDNILTCTLQD